jgi:uncharacterized protein (TIGR00725 family)
MKQRAVAVFGASKSLPNDPSYRDGVRCGTLLAKAGFAVATGGYGGLMEAVSRGASEAGGHVVGFTAPPVFPDRDSANPYVQTEVAADSLTERIHRMIEETDASIALEGSIGTFAELVLAWHVAFVAQFSGSQPKPVIAIGPVWRALVEELADKLDTTADYVTCVDTVEEAVAAVRSLLAG